MTLTTRLHLASALATCSALLACGGGSPAPITINNLALTLAEDTSISAAVIARDPEGKTLTYSATTQPAHGSLTLDATTGAIAYTPNTDYFGSDSATVSASAGSRSAVATITFTVTGTPDAPRISAVSDQQNNAYALETTVPVEIVDIDGDVLTVTAAAANPAIATVSVAGEAKSLVITPVAHGATSVTVTVSDGALDATTTFQFNVGDVTKIATVSANSGALEATPAATPPTASGKTIALMNSSDREVSFSLTYNGHKAFTSLDEIVEFVRNLPERLPQEPFERKLWRFVRDNTYHEVPINAQQWWYDYWPTLNSLGFGFCGHVAAVYVEVARAAGYKARVWGLYGHVVPEIKVNGRWQLYDPDLNVYYHMRDGNVAGVEDLAADPTLITTPTTPVYGASDNFAYSSTVADFYDAATGSNYIGDHVFLASTPPGSSQIRLPAGARLLLPGHWTAAPTGVDGTTPYHVRAYRQAALELPPGWSGSITLPWVLWDVQGQGSISLGSQHFAADSPELRSFLAAPGTALTTAAVTENPNGLRLVFMINATWYDLLDQNDVEILGQDVWAVSIGTASVDQSIQVDPFPSHLRRPAI
jgi:hypothetical protein